MTYAPKTATPRQYLIEVLRMHILDIERGNQTHVPVSFLRSIAELLSTPTPTMDALFDGSDAHLLDASAQEKIRELEEELAAFQSAGRDKAVYPEQCPITRRAFFMVIEHPEIGDVPTYGGPFDSYTIPHMLGEASEQFHLRELEVHRYDHDRGHWVDDEVIPLRVAHDDVLEAIYATPPAQSELERDGWIPVSESVPEDKGTPRQVIVVCTKQYGGNYKGQGQRRFIQDWVVRSWPQNFTHWMEAMPWPAAMSPKGQGVGE